MGRWRWQRVDPTSDRPVHKQVADAIRSDIETGQLPPGTPLPSEAHLGQVFEVGRNSIRNALAVLRGEGLVVSEAGRGTWVRDHEAWTVVSVPPGARITCRMPTEAERRELGAAEGRVVPEGVPVVVVDRDGRVELLAGDRVVLETVASDEPQSTTS